MIDKYFTQTVLIFEEYEKEEAEQYLRLWKKYLLRAYPNLTLVEEAFKYDTFREYVTLTLTLCMSFYEADYETPPV